MEQPLLQNRPAKRRVPKEANEPKSKTVAVSDAAFTRVEQSAKKLQMSKSKYASAAIAFFAEAGLDPTKERAAGLAEVTATVSREARSIRVQNVDIGNRLISILRAWEKSSYGFMQQQQGGTLNYLEQIENAILRHQVALETNFLSPMVEMLVKNNVETYLARVVMERVSLHVGGREQTEWPAANKRLNDDRDQQVVVLMREFIKTNGMPAPQLTPKPQVPAIPPKASVTPAVGMPVVGDTPKQAAQP